MNFLNVLSDYQGYRGVIKNIDKAPISVAGVVESAQGHLIYALSKELKTCALILTYSDMEAREIKNDLDFYFDDVLYLPERDYIFHNIESTDRSRQHMRLTVMSELLEEKQHIVVASLDSVMLYTAERELLKSHTLNLEAGKCYNIEELSKKLTVMGYVREDMVEGKGQFSLRGGIMDIFSPNEENPVRIDFFDDEIETIKYFDVLTQRSVEECGSVKIIPTNEIILTDEKQREVTDNLKRISEKAKKQGLDELLATLGTDIENFTERRYFPSMDKFVYDIYGKIPTVFDYLDKDTLVFIADPKRICERGKSFDREKAEIVTELSERSIIEDVKKPFYFSYNEALSEIHKRRAVCFEPLTHTKNDFKYGHLETFVTKTTVSFHGKVEYLYDDLKSYREKGTTVVILASTKGRCENLKGVLNEKGFDVRISDGDFEKGEIVIIHGAQNKGFEYSEIGFVLISDTEIFESKRRKKSRRKENANRLKSYNDISVGDYIVHETHGIGQYMGMNRMTVANVTKDYFKIQYRGTDVLYVPVDQMDLLYKYVGNTDRALRLNKLGTQEWNKTKQKVRASTAEMAEQLVKLYAERERIKGHAYSEDTPWQRDFEDTFLYQETDDQLRSIEEVKSDMEDVKPMDRLLCGDVGFGKTEVALRAAFKAVADSKQVAYFCPTTILAMQHYETFVKRMENFPIKVEMLSRFRTAKQSEKIKKQLKSGEIDIVIGTHKLLSKDVNFKDLGLLIIDEEQRFGVAHKERLKELKTSVDVLTMTATPIPRTLHMAMTSVRDMSVLTMPPENRFPVTTYVLEENETVILDAIRNELSRGGQVFYLHNSVSDIFHKAEWIKKHFPNINVSVGHGKMKESELEDIMCDMVDGNIDVLVCTTIIETGLDIPNANTIIIENADRMGLAQLYQLRGRVGRSNRMAYAYLVYKKDKILSEVASKRLRAIREFTEFGSGFKIAMRDLEIRGAGNLLGPQQHGHMDTVGYDMYCKLLKESINEARDIKTNDDINVLIDVEADAYLSESYISNPNQRIDMYKRIAAIASEDDKFEIEDELNDRYGKIPKSVSNIIEVAMLKLVAKDIGICEIVQRGKKLELKFVEDALDATLIWDIDGKFPKRIKVGSLDMPVLSFKIELTDPPILKLLDNLLNTILELKNQ